MDQLEAALEASGIGELVKLWVGRIPWPSSGKAKKNDLSVLGCQAGDILLSRTPSQGRQE